MAMKFQREATGEFAIAAYTAESVTIGAVNRVEYRDSVAVSHAQPPAPWPVRSFADIAADAIAHATRMQAEIVLIGTGRTLRFPRPDALRPLIEARIGYEVMDTSAACRTYNVLLGEGRQVAALLLFER